VLTRLDIYAFIACEFEASKNMNTSVVLKLLDVNWQSFDSMCKEARISMLIFNNNSNRS